MRDAVVIGGGPGGLFCAILLRLADPAIDVRVIERNEPGDTFGFGVAFHKATLRKIAEADPVFLESLREILNPWDEVAFHIRDREFRLSGHGFAGCSRHRLLSVLQERAAGLGVKVEYGRSTTAADHRDADLVVVADGSSSRNRSALADAVRPTVVERPNRFVWLGTDRPLAEMNFFFREHSAGLFVAHAYPHQAGQGTWIVETDEETFAAAGLETATESETRALMEEVFAADLEGYSLITRDSFWRQFPLVNCERWTVGNVALLGDAKATVHYSIGSGTKIAMEDATVLVQAVTTSTTVEAGLAKYEAVRRPEVGQLQRNAFGSMQWFESLRARWPMDPAQFALSGLTRKTDETYRAISERAPDIAAAAVRAFQGSGSAASPVQAPITLSGLTFPSRRVADERTLVIALPRGAADVSPSLEQALQQEALAAIDLLLLDVDPDLLCEQADDKPVSQALDAFEVVCAAWPDPGRVGLRIHPTREPAQALPLLARFVARGCRLIAVAPGGVDAAHQCVVSDLVRHGLGVATICEGLASVDEAETALVAGRADLIGIS